MRVCFTANQNSTFMNQWDFVVCNFKPDQIYILGNQDNVVISNPLKDAVFINSYDELPDEFKGKSIKELEANEITGVTIVGFKSPDGEYIVNPDSELKVIEGTKIFVLGSTDQIVKLAKHFHLKHWINDEK